MRAVVTGGAGFIGSHLVDALVARGDEVTVVDDLSTGKRENLNRGARSSSTTSASRSRSTPTSSSTSPRRPTWARRCERPAFDAEVNVVGTVNVLEAARAAGAQVVFASTGGAIYGESSGRPAEDARCGPVSPYGIAKLAPSSTSGLEPRSTARGTSCCASQTSTGRGRRPRSRAASSRSSSSACDGGERDARSSATASRRATSSTSATSSTRVLAAAERRGGVFNVGTGVETTVVELYRLCAEGGGHRRGRQPRWPPRRATRGAACSTRPARGASSAGGRRRRSTEGLRADVGALARLSAPAPPGRSSRSGPPFWLGTALALRLGAVRRRASVGDAYGAVERPPLPHVRAVGRALVRADRRARLCGGASRRRRSSRVYPALVHARRVGDRVRRWSPATLISLASAARGGGRARRAGARQLLGDRARATRVLLPRALPRRRFVFTAVYSDGLFLALAAACVPRRERGRPRARRACSAGSRPGRG